MKTRHYIILFIILIISYVGLTLLPAPDPKALVQYNLSVSQARLLSLTIVLPVVAIWLVAMYGFVKIKDYAQLIKNSKDGAALNTISTGLLFLALGSPFSAVLTSVSAQLVKRHPDWLAATTIINNYITLIIMALGMFFIAKGAEQLVKLVGKKSGNNEQRLLVLLFIVLSTLYSYFLISQPIQTPAGQRIYYMSHIMVLLTLAIPYLYYWYRGLLGAYYLYWYQKNVPGRVYKGSLSYVAGGIFTVIMTSILVRGLVTISARISTLGLPPILLIIYCLLLISGLGYVLIAIGAKKLRKIEEV